MREGFRQLVFGITLTAASMVVQAQSYITDKVVVGVYDQPFSSSTLLKVIPTGTPLEILERRDAFSQIRTPDDTTGWVENTYIIDNKPDQLVVLELTDKQTQTRQALDESRQQLLALQEQLATVQDKAAGAQQADSTALKKQQQANSVLKNQLDTLRAELGAAEKKLADISVQRDKLNKEVKALRAAQQQVAAKSLPAAPVSEATVDSSLAELQASNTALRKKLDAVYAALEIKTMSGSAGSTPNVQDVHFPIGWLVLAVLILVLGGFAAGMKTLDRLHLKRHGGFRI
jgi:SH3 domain protein